MSKKDGGYAFPRSEFADAIERSGMSLRDWFAGQAIQLAWERWMKDGPVVVAEESYKIADAMLNEREK